ncbi:hypothetical protein ABIB25_002869 [Nakamurella sp. UYEF19]
MTDVALVTQPDAGGRKVGNITNADSTVRFALVAPGDAA